MAEEKYPETPENKLSEAEKSQKAALVRRLIAKDQKSSILVPKHVREHIRKPFATLSQDTGLTSANHDNLSDDALIDSVISQNNDKDDVKIAHLLIEAFRPEYGWWQSDERSQYWYGTVREALTKSVVLLRVENINDQQISTILEVIDVLDKGIVNSKMREHPINFINDLIIRCYNQSASQAILQIFIGWEKSKTVFKPFWTKGLLSTAPDDDKANFSKFTTELSEKFIQEYFPADASEILRKNKLSNNTLNHSALQTLEDLKEIETPGERKSEGENITLNRSPRLMLATRIFILLILSGLTAALGIVALPYFIGAGSGWVLGLQIGLPLLFLIPAIGFLRSNTFTEKLISTGIALLLIAALAVYVGLSPLSTTFVATTLASVTAVTATSVLVSLGFIAIGLYIVYRSYLLFPKNNQSWDGREKYAIWMFAGVMILTLGVVFLLPVLGSNIVIPIGAPLFTMIGGAAIFLVIDLVIEKNGLARINLTQNILPDNAKIADNLLQAGTYTPPSISNLIAPQVVNSSSISTENKADPIPLEKISQEHQKNITYLTSFYDNFIKETPDNQIQILKQLAKVTYTKGQYTFTVSNEKLIIVANSSLSGGVNYTHTYTLSSNQVILQRQVKTFDGAVYSSSDLILRGNQITSTTLDPSHSQQESLSNLDNFLQEAVTDSVVKFSAPSTLRELDYHSNQEPFTVIYTAWAAYNAQNVTLTNESVKQKTDQLEEKASGASNPYALSAFNKKAEQPELTSKEYAIYLNSFYHHFINQDKTRQEAILLEICKRIDASYQKGTNFTITVTGTSVIVEYKVCRSRSGNQYTGKFTFEHNKATLERVDDVKDADSGSPEPYSRSYKTMIQGENIQHEGGDEAFLTSMAKYVYINDLTSSEEEVVGPDINNQKAIELAKNTAQEELVGPDIKEQKDTEQHLSRTYIYSDKTGYKLVSQQKSSALAPFVCDADFKLTLDNLVQKMKDKYLNFSPNDQNQALSAFTTLYLWTKDAPNLKNEISFDLGTSLHKIVQYSINNQRLSRAVCVYLKWLNEDGTAHPQAPDFIKSIVSNIEFEQKPRPFSYGSPG